MDAEWCLRAAAEADLAEVRRLLAEATLPLDGLESFFPAEYVVVAGGGDAIAGVAGLEIHGTHGLLRSVVVRSSVRGRSLGEALVRDRLARARARELAGVYLLTTTAAV